MNAARATIVLLAALALAAALSSAAVTDIIDNPDEPDNPKLVVTSSKPETTYEGNLKLPNVGRIEVYRFQSMYASSEQACYYQPMLPMRNLTISGILNNYWDLDMRVTVHDSEGNLVASSSGIKKRTYAAVVVELKNTPAAGVYEICYINEGSSKKVMHTIVVMNDKFSDMIEKYINFTDDQKALVERMDKLNTFLAKVELFDDEYVSVLSQDYFRLQNIKGWLDKDGVLGCFAILLSSFLSTAIVKRWFRNVGGGA